MCVQAAGRYCAQPLLRVQSGCQKMQLATFCPIYPHGTAQPSNERFSLNFMCGISVKIQGDQKVSVHLMITVYLNNPPHNWWFEDGHHRVRSEWGLCYTEHCLREHSSACQLMIGDWQGTLWTLLATFCIVIIRCTEPLCSLCMSPSQAAFEGGEWGDRPRPRASGLRSSLWVCQAYQSRYWYSGPAWSWLALGPVYS
jgi:hypothetical protein